MNISSNSPLNHSTGIIRLLLLDDHPVLREGLNALVEPELDMMICGIAHTAEGAMLVLESESPDIVVLDWSLPERGGIHLLTDIKSRYPEVRVLVYSMHDETLYAERAIRAGADGYLMKTQSPDDFLVAVRKIISGQLAVSESVQKRLVNVSLARRRKSTNTSVSGLSNRELEVFGGLGEGKSVREISHGLALSIKTVEAHCANIKRKLNLKDAQHLLQEAARWKSAVT